MEMDAIIHVVNQLGLPVGMVIVLFFGGWKAAAWCGPRIERWVNDYMATQVKNTEILRELAAKSIELAEENAHVLEKIEETLQTLTTLVRKNSHKP